MVEDGLEDCVGGRGVDAGGGEPALLGDDVVREDGVVDGVGVAEGVVSAQLLVAAGVVQQRGGAGGERGERRKSLADGDGLGVAHHLVGVAALKRHHLRKRAIRRAVRGYVTIVEPEQLAEPVHRVAQPRSALRRSSSAR